MNKVIELSLVFTILAACQKENLSPLPRNDYWGEVLGEKNGEVWSPSVIGLNGSDLPNPDIYFLQFDDYGMCNNLSYISTLSFSRLPADSLGLFRITGKRGQNTNNSIFASYFTVIGGDVLGDVYDVLSLENNFIEITEVKGNEIKGNFSISLVRDISKGRYVEVSDTITFTAKKFHTRMVSSKEG